MATNHATGRASEHLLEVGTLFARHCAPADQFEVGLDALSVIIRPGDGQVLSVRLYGSDPRPVTTHRFPLFFTLLTHTGLPYIRRHSIPQFHGF